MQTKYTLQTRGSSELAKLIEANHSIIGKYEHDEVKPSIDIAKRMADAFEVSLDYLAKKWLSGLRMLTK